ncbi:MAG: DUF2490 domain-containing protein [Chitinophagaceae bacterium]|jgi:hypothetical protein|nr:DUF2490 domain-containing protein [Chitinophagaceae bacterium]
MFHQLFRISIILLLLFLPFQNFSQSLGCWNSLNLSFDNGKKWSFASELQLRSLQFYKNYNYHEYKGIVTYKLIPNLQTSLVVGRYTTFGSGKTFQNPKLAEEFRVALQLGLKNTIGKVQVDHRYRVEKRYYTSGIQGVRIRYRVGLSTPLDKKKLTSLSLSNEFLIAINSGSSIIKYDKNRINIGVTRKLSNMVSMQVGYLSQYDSKSADEPGNNFFVYSLFLNMSKLATQKVHHSEN